MERIPLFSASAANADFDCIAPIKRVTDKYWYVLGDEVANFEAEFARYVGVGNCVSLANGTDALELALRAVGVKKGDAVVAVANAGFYSSTAIYSIGATPLYVDVDEDTLTMSADALASALLEKPTAVVVTHLYGQLASIAKLVTLARDAGVAIIEDCAQSHGARRDSKQAGSFGDIACFSFYPTKNLGALGDGGAIVTDDATLAAHVRQLRQYGWSSKYEVALAGGRNSRLDELQAAVLRDKLPLLDKWNARRREIAQQYNAAFAVLPVICPPSTSEDYVAHLYVIRVEKRAEFRHFLDARGIATDIHYPIPDHKQPAYPLENKPHVTVTERATETIVSLPCFPGMTDAQVTHVIETVIIYFNA